MKKYLLLAFILSIVTICKAQKPEFWASSTQGSGPDMGTIFKITGEIDTVEYYFKGSPDGNGPSGSLIKANNGLLYGMTVLGGTNNMGTIFSYDISTGVENVLFSFGAGSNGQLPLGSLIQAGDGLLYGLTSQGGTNDAGIIFSYTISTGVETVLHNFNSNIDGEGAGGTLFQAGNGLLYGLTQGTPGGLFSYNISTGKDTLVYNMRLDSTNQLTYDNAVIEVNDSLLYGETYEGGANNKGFIFKYNITSGTGADVDDFGAYSIGYPSGSLTLAPNGLLYGVSQEGGGGTVFVFNTATNEDSLIHSFAFQSESGFDPGNALTLVSNDLYGMTDKGGIYASGTVFNYNPITGAYNIIASLDQFATYSKLLEVDSTTGINQLTDDNEQLSVYPNPSSDFIYVNLSQQQNQPVQLSLYNMLGQEVYTTLTPSNINSNLTATIMVTNLPNGIYVLRVNDGKAEQKQEVVVAR